MRSITSTEPTIYADAPLARLLAAVERRAPHLEDAIAEYARARRAAGVRPESAIVELKRVFCRAAGRDPAKPSTPLAGRLTHRLIELYFAA